MFTAVCHCQRYCTSDLDFFKMSERAIDHLDKCGKGLSYNKNVGFIVDPVYYLNRITFFQSLPWHHVLVARRLFPKYNIPITAEMRTETALNLLSNILGRKRSNYEKDLQQTENYQPVSSQRFTNPRFWKSRT